MKTIRKALGLTQEQLAGYLGITRSQLSVTESAGRGLPSVAAVVKYDRLAKALASKKKPQQLPALEKAQQQAFIKTVRGRKTLAEQKAVLLRYRLKKMAADYQQCMKALLLVQELLPLVPEGREGKGEKLWLEILEDDTRLKLEKCGPAAQKLLQLEIDLLDLEVKKTGQLL